MKRGRSTGRERAGLELSGGKARPERGRLRVIGNRRSERCSRNSFTELMRWWREDE